MQVVEQQEGDLPPSDQQNNQPAEIDKAINSNSFVDNLSPQLEKLVVTDDFLQVLEEHRKICEKEGKLDEAQAARKRLRELRVVNENRKRDTLVSKHTVEMEALE